MKMTKKLVFVMVTLLLVLSMVVIGCDVFGKADVGGTKHSTTLTVDASGTKPENTIDTKYRRAFKKISKTEDVGFITTKITVDTADVTGASVVGYMFDIHTKDKKMSFNLIGWKPFDGSNKFYIERYENVDLAKLRKDDAGNPLDTDESSLGDYKSFVGDVGSMTLGNEQVPNDWKDLPIGVVETTAAKASLTISIKQEPEGTYAVYFGAGDNAKKIATYKGAVKSKDNSDPEWDKYCVGGIGVYANCIKGAKVVAKYDTEKNTFKDKTIVGPAFNMIEE